MNLRLQSNNCDFQDNADFQDYALMFKTKNLINSKSLKMRYLGGENVCVMCVYV